MVERENKREIVQALLPVLQKTRHFSDLVNLQYETHEDCAERVVATYVNGHKNRVNVTADSGYALILDILRGI